ncbi:hypoxanthine phosphoribosyltransferase [Tyzzerella sp. An114]|uniref:hypoxanthine phosphoribosyltransferase n=1 Tax=Tyzzerella sp. An114 TaxID=1965545 RepID=UPI000B4505AB|nr:hypoxanthine phosphoribosyltransferase [Tyzzerella sp. An114]OUQ59126.1 hypoxanthine phosphoribosyltransferase [Tyzzerella sp. An114]HIT73014.1 hypoxanthine phosphoribosyltransferase [Candidatus Fimicola cottocaccae]
MKEKIETLISTSAIEKRLDELAEVINSDYKGEEIYLVCVLKGGVFFMVQLSKRLTSPVSLNFMDVSSYGDGTESSGHIKILMDLDESIEGKNVLIVEDIIDSGRTLSHLVNLLNSRNPKSLKICTLLDKPDRRVSQVDVAYTGFTIPDAFVVGYGLDYAQKYRNLDYIGVISFEEE